jgi:hypothetical protein
MTRPDDQTRQTPRTVDRRGGLEEATARLAGITNRLADSGIDAAELRKDAEELSAIVHRLEWLADISAP